MGYVHYANLGNLSAIRKAFVPGETIRYKINDIEFTDTVKSYTWMCDSTDGPAENQVYYIGDFSVLNDSNDENEVDYTFETKHFIGLFGENNSAVIYMSDCKNTLESFKIYTTVIDAKTEVTYVEDESTIEPKLKESYLPESVMTEPKEGYVISKALNDLNQKINDIDLTEEIEQLKDDIENEILWESSGTGIKTKNASGCGSSGVVAGIWAAGSYSSVSIGCSAKSGNHSVSIGPDSYAYGYYCTSLGYYANGSDNRSDYTVCLGSRTKVSNSYEIALGAYNSSTCTSSTIGNKGNTHFSIAYPNGTSYNRKNVLEIMQNGDVYIYGLGNYNGVYSSSATRLQDLLGANTYDDTAVRGLITTNTTNIATNTTNIATNKANITTNATNIATNKTNIATNTAAIKTLQEDLEEAEYVTASALTDLNNRLSWNII